VTYEYIVSHAKERNSVGRNGYKVDKSVFKFAAPDLCGPLNELQAHSVGSVGGCATGRDKTFESECRGECGRRKLREEIGSASKK
jgi:hypothetical protein